MRILLLFSMLALGVARVAAADTKAKSAEPMEERPAILVPQPAQKIAPKSLSGRRLALPPAGTQSRRAVSPEVGANISAVATRAAPPVAPAPAVAPTPATTNGDSSDAVKLEAVIVNEDKVPEFKARDLLTVEGKKALAQKLNPGLRAGKLPLGNNGVAQEMLQDHFEQERRGELAELKSVLSSGGVKAPPEVQRKIDEAMTRKGDWLNQKPGTPFREPR